MMKPMKRQLRWAFNALTALSLFLSLVSAVGWARTLSEPTTCLVHYRIRPDARYVGEVWLMSYDDGSLGFETRNAKEFSVCRPGSIATFFQVLVGLYRVQLFLRQRALRPNSCYGVILDGASAREMSYKDKQGWKPPFYKFPIDSWRSYPLTLCDMFIPWYCLPPLFSILPVFRLVTFSRPRLLCFAAANATGLCPRLRRYDSASYARTLPGVWIDDARHGIMPPLQPGGLA